MCRHLPGCLLVAEIVNDAFARFAVCRVACGSFRNVQNRVVVIVRHMWSVVKPLRSLFLRIGHTATFHAQNNLGSALRAITRKPACSSTRLIRCRAGRLRSTLQLYLLVRHEEYGCGGHCRFAIDIRVVQVNGAITCPQIAPLRSSIVIAPSRHTWNH